MFEYYNINFKKLLGLLVIVLCAVLGIFLTFRLSIFLAPFLIAFIVSLLMEPLIKLLVRKARFPRRAAAAVSLILVLGAFGSVVFLLVSKLIAELKELSVLFPTYFMQVYNEILKLIDQASEIYHGLPQEVLNNIESLSADFTGKLNLQGIIDSVSSYLLGIISGISNLPQALIFILVTILSTFFLASDREKIGSTFKSHLPEALIEKYQSIKNDMFFAFFGYIKAQLILMSITLTELLIGFSVIGINYAILLAFLISIIDALPILGTGSILIPWAVYNFITGDIRMGLSLVILYGIVLVVRQMIEPKVLGQQIGVHPLLTLLAMYSGLKLLGVIGLIIGPITLLLLKNILQGVFKGRTLKEYLAREKSPD